LHSQFDTGGDLRIGLKLLCGVPLLAALTMLRRAYERSIPFRKPIAERPDSLQRRSLWVFSFSSYQVAGYDIIDRMRLLLTAVFVAWAIFFIGLVTL
jgi:hypothetical protein